MVHTQVKLDVVSTNLPGDTTVYIVAMQDNGRLSSGCRTLGEFDEQVEFLNRELKALRREAEKHLTH